MRAGVPGVLRVGVTVLGALLALSARTVGEPPASGLASAAEPGELVVMSYNLRYASQTPPNAWPDRRPLVRNLILGYAPDLIGTQEGKEAQLKDMASDLPGYDWIGVGRDGGDRGEFMAVFYRRDRLQALDQNHFWLSDTPEVVASATWGNTCRRMVTGVIFRDRVTGRDFRFWNTHFDHQVQVAREKSAELVRARLQAAAPGLPVILTGDFNAVAGSNRAYDILTGDGFLRDTWALAAGRRNAEYGSFNGFAEPAKNGQRIDWVLARGPVTVRATEIAVGTGHPPFPSDHFPIVVWLRIGP